MRPSTTRTHMICTLGGRPELALMDANRLMQCTSCSALMVLRAKCTSSTSVCARACAGAQEWNCGARGCACSRWCFQSWHTKHRTWCQQSRRTDASQRMGNWAQRGTTSPLLLAPFARPLSWHPCSWHPLPARSPGTLAPGTHAISLGSLLSRHPQPSLLVPILHTYPWPSFGKLA